ncbi:hypothetical protein DB346_21365 [Verrucomicrobia bacterium LW23]|nr:hypothetical protein DB346_21365 [Verrucomicrobia bacterium LW23]
MALTITDDLLAKDQSWAPKLLAHEIVDGLILNYTHSISVQLIEAIERYRIPAVSFSSLTGMSLPAESFFTRESLLGSR